MFSVYGVSFSNNNSADTFADGIESILYFGYHTSIHGAISLELFERLLVDVGNDRRFIFWVSQHSCMLKAVDESYIVEWC